MRGLFSSLCTFFIQIFFLVFCVFLCNKNKISKKSQSTSQLVTSYWCVKVCLHVVSVHVVGVHVVSVHVVSVHIVSWACVTAERWSSSSSATQTIKPKKVHVQLATLGLSGSMLSALSWCCCFLLLWIFTLFLSFSTTTGELRSCLSVNSRMKQATWGTCKSSPRPLDSLKTV